MILIVRGIISMVLIVRRAVGREAVATKNDAVYADARAGRSAEIAVVSGAMVLIVVAAMILIVVAGAGRALAKTKARVRPAFVHGVCDINESHFSNQGRGSEKADSYRERTVSHRILQLGGGQTIGFSTPRCRLPYGGHCERN
jgi:hypothetical protein